MMLNNIICFVRLIIPYVFNHASSCCFFMYKSNKKVQDQQDMDASASCAAKDNNEHEVAKTVQINAQDPNHQVATKPRDDVNKKDEEDVLQTTLNTNTSTENDNSSSDENTVDYNYRKCKEKIEEAIKNSPLERKKAATKIASITTPPKSTGYDNNDGTATSNAPATNQPGITTDKLPEAKKVCQIHCLIVFVLFNLLHSTHLYIYF